MDMSSTDTSATGTGTGETVAQKLLGNPSVDITDATYRFVADYLRNLVFEAVQGQYPEFEHTLIGRQLEQIVGYVLAAAVELAPGQVLLEQRQRLAQNLRVQTYQEFENKLYEFGKERIKDVVAKGAEGRARNTGALLEQVQEMINRAEHNIERAQARKIDDAIERIGGGRPPLETC